MKTTLQMLALLVIAIGFVLFFALPDKHKDVGLWAYIPYETFWAVDVENDYISNADRLFSKGQRCVLEFGGKVTVVKVSVTGRYTLRYEGPDGKNGSGSVCGNGTLYNMVGRPNLEQMTKNYLETLEATYVEMSNATAALHNGPIGKPFTVKEDAYVIIITLNGIKNRTDYREFDFNETCLIQTGGRLTPLGAVKTRKGVRLLHKYQYPGGRQSIGAECGNGTLIYY